MAMEEAFDVEIADDDAQKILKVKDAISLRAEPHELSLVLFEARKRERETAARARALFLPFLLRQSILPGVL